MIKVNNINGKPESIPDGDFAVHSDEQFFYFFKSESDRIEWFEKNNIAYNE